MSFISQVQAGSSDFLLYRRGRASINPTANQYSLRDGRQVTIENNPDKVMPSSGCRSWK
jgi:hypothetical protein